MTLNGQKPRCGEILDVNLIGQLDWKISEILMRRLRSVLGEKAVTERTRDDVPGTTSSQEASTNNLLTEQMLKVWRYAEFRATPQTRPDTAFATFKNC